MIRNILHLMSIWIVVLPFMAGIINFKRLNRDSRWIFFLVSAAVPPQLLTFFINEHSPLLNISYNVYSIIELVILFIIFSGKYQHRAHKIIFRLCPIAFIALSIWFFRDKGLSSEFKNLLVSANNIVYLVWVLLFLREQYSVPETIIHRRSPFAWYLLALLIYAPCCALLFVLYHYIRDTTNPVLPKLWIIHNVCNILLYIIFSVGLYIPQQKRAVLE